VPTEVPFDLKSLNKLGYGEVNERFVKLCQLAVKDCENRPASSRARSVTLKVDFYPVSESSAPGEPPHMDRVDTQFTFKASIPAFNSRLFRMIPKHDGALMFNPDVPDDPSRKTLFNDQERQDDEEEDRRDLR
jgi:hypothetical protein